MAVKNFKKISIQGSDPMMIKNRVFIEILIIFEKNSCTYNLIMVKMRY